MINVKYRALRSDGKGWAFGLPLICESYSAFEGEEMSNLHITSTLLDECIETCLGDGLLSIKAHTRKAAPQSLGQFTGLKDKNGVEIYEGDIVDCYWLAELGVCEIDCQHKGVVRFVDCRFEVSFSDKAFIRNIGEDGVYSAMELELTCMSHDDDYAVEYEVIGNIHENPELLT